MVKAILDGRKTVTRRICKDQTAKKYMYVKNCEQYPSTLGKTYTGWAKDCGFSFLLPTKPPYQKGDLLWVRETYCYGIEWDDTKPGDVDPLCGGNDIWYLADGERPSEGWGKTRSGRFMTKWAARIWLEVLDVRAERLQEITGEDAMVWRYEFKRIKQGSNEKAKTT